jgi:signal transduction histidine kinase
MQPAALPVNELERLKTLYSYHILDTLPEKDFDDITKLASEICGTSISAITLVDKDRQWFKSEVGLDKKETPRDISFCAHALLSPHEILVVSNAKNDYRFFDYPNVTEENGIVFYAGVPLCSENGLALGTLCVVDTKPQQLSDRQLDSLRALANQVVGQLQLRRNNLELKLNQFSLKSINTELERFAQVIAHDLKSPANNIIGLTELLKDANEYRLNEEGLELVGHINDAAHQLKFLVDDVLSFSRSIDFSEEMLSEFSFGELGTTVKSMVVWPPEFALILQGDNAQILSSKSALVQILLNLCTNAVRFNDKDKGVITIKFISDPDRYTFFVTDNGKGIETKNFDKIFQKNYSTQAGPDKVNMLGQGIGLSTVKRLVNKLGGDITVSSELGKWSRFEFHIAKMNNGHYQLP